MILHAACKIAEHIMKELSPFCDRIEIAGSIRRAREGPNDIDIVVLPKSGEHAAQLRQRCRRTAAPRVEGTDISSFQLKGGQQLDLFFARGRSTDLLETRPGNFGVLWLIRTGSKEHNIFLIEHAKKMDLVLKPGVGVVDAAGKILASETEEEIFRALGLDYIPPALRER